MVDEMEIYTGLRVVHQHPPNDDCFIPVCISSLGISTLIAKNTQDLDVWVVFCISDRVGKHNP